MPLAAPRFPATRVTDTKELLFGTAVEDPYRWLEDEKSSEVREWMTAQDLRCVQRYSQSQKECRLPSIFAFPQRRPRSPSNIEFREMISGVAK